MVVEAELRDMLGTPACAEKRSGLSGRRCHCAGYRSALRGTLLSIPPWRDFGMPVLFCSHRQAACRFVEGFLQRYHRKEEMA